MEDLTPPLLSAVREVRWRIGSGRSMKEAVSLYLETAANEFAVRLREWWTLKQQGRESSANSFPTHLQQAFLHLIERGLAGQPVLEALTALENEVDSAAQNELELFLAALPFKVLLPMLAFQFPAYMILLLGPMLRELGRQMGG